MVTQQHINAERGMEQPGKQYHYVKRHKNKKGHLLGMTAAKGLELDSMKRHAVWWDIHHFYE